MKKVTLLLTLCVGLFASEVPWVNASVEKACVEGKTWYLFSAGRGLYSPQFVPKLIYTTPVGENNPTKVSQESCNGSKK